MTFAPTDPEAVPALVLVADDDPVARQITASLLRSRGYETCEAADGVEALDVVAARDPDLVLLDVRMPRMDGTNVVRHLRKDPARAELPILLVTALDDSVARIAGLEAGADDYLTKPYDRLELVARVRSILRLNRYRRLQHSRDGLEWVIGQSPVGFVWLNEGGEVEAANAAAHVMLGFGPGSLADGPRPLLARLRGRFSLEPASLWASWPCPAPDDLPRLLVRQGEQAEEFQVIQVSVLPAPVSLRRLVRLEDVTNAYRTSASLHALYDGLEHRIRGPLASLVASLDLMVLAQPPNEFHQGVQLAAERLTGVIEEVVACGRQMSRPEHEGVAMRDLASLVERAAESDDVAHLRLPAVPRALQRARIALRSRELEMVFREVFHVARRHHPIGRPSIEVRLCPHPGGARLRIITDGLPADADACARLLLPYAPSAHPRGWYMAGVGQGLSAAAAAVWRAGGRLEFTALRGRKAPVVDIVLPFTAQSAWQLQSAEPDDLTRGGIMILPDGARRHSEAS